MKKAVLIAVCLLAMIPSLSVGSELKRGDLIQFAETEHLYFVYIVTRDAVFITDCPRGNAYNLHFGWEAERKQLEKAKVYRAGDPDFKDKAAIFLNQNPIRRGG